MLWWQRYRQFGLEKFWPGASGLLHTGAATMPEAVAENLPKLLLAFAAQDTLKSAEDALMILMRQGDITSVLYRVQCHYIVRVLRDCRKFNLEVDSTWYDFLLELFEEGIWA
jgi:hypothetical protein